MMPYSEFSFDFKLASVTILAFGLPLTLLIPGFSIWNIIPKVRVSRFHIFSVHLTWTQLNSLAVALMILFLCIYLEIRKRILDKMLADVLSVRQATITVIDTETERQLATKKACAEMLGTSAEYYESIALLQDELRKRNQSCDQHPPAIVLSSWEM